MPGPITGRTFFVHGEALVIVRFGDQISGTINLTNAVFDPPALLDDDVEDEDDEDTDFDEEALFEANPMFSGEPNLYELGLASEGISVTPQFHHKDMHVDDFGPHVPVEVMWNMAECRIRMDLIHYSPAVLATCISESTGGTEVDPLGFTNEGVVSPTGTVLGKGKALFASGNNFMSVSILSPALTYPWHFRTCYLPENPITYPLGTGKSIVSLNWRVIPYAPLYNARVVNLETYYGQLVSGHVKFSGAIQELKSDEAVLWNRNPADITDIDILNALAAL